MAVSSLGRGSERDNVGHLIAKARREEQREASSAAKAQALVARVVDHAKRGAARSRVGCWWRVFAASVYKYAAVQPRWPQISPLGF